ncbi:hypothetical protein WKI65_36625 [Streptomyces sp. MS1.AVA.3]|uniref:hypothetical protein n=1 Tax=Streptomyces decoyicus TaxID=249567 RepID=UPI0030C0CF39
MAASLEAGVQAAVAIRRQLRKGVPDLQVLSKVTALPAKDLLRFDGTEQAADTDVGGL